MSVFHSIRKVAGEFIRLSKNYSTKRNTNHIRKIAPGHIKTQPKKFDRDDDYLNDPNIGKRILDDIQRTGSMELEEPDMESFNDTYLEYNREAENLKFKMRSNKMTRKHFNEYIEKEVNLLTYAEKEHIRYLHNMDPENWSPERISESFPISSDGAIKILNSTFRARTFEDAIAHDQGVAKKIQLVKQGVIKLTPELKRKMELRSKVPLKLGAAQQYHQLMSSKALSVPQQKIPGEFESLVASPQNSSARNSKDIPFPHSSPSKAEMEPEQELYTQMSDRNNSNEFKKLKISSGKIMMLDELESRFNESRESKSEKGVAESSTSDPDAALDYLMSLDNKTLLDDKTSKESCDMWNPEEEFHPGTICKKFKESSEENRNANKPNQPVMEMESDGFENGIVIPPELKQSGALYKIGNKYFDEDGQFLYRVI